MSETIDDRFWSKVEFTDTCWLWRSGVRGGGYGAFKVNGHHVQAHRWAYEAMIGPIPDGLTLDHLCRIRPCVRPAHLEPVTFAENVRRGLAGYGSHGGLGAIKKARCIRGHLLSEARPAKKGRDCLPCHNENQRKHYWRRKTTTAWEALRA